MRRNTLSNYQNKLEVKKALLEDAAFYDIQMNDLKLMLWTAQLQDVDALDVRRAQAHFRDKPNQKFMPMPGEIKNFLNPLVSEDGQARQIAAKVQGAVVKFGYTNGKDAKEFIGDIGWAIVERFGGWSYICQNLGTGIDVNAFQAQVRELAKSQVSFGESQLANQINGTEAPNLLTKNDNQSVNVNKANALVKMALNR